MDANRSIAVYVDQTLDKCGEFLEKSDGPPLRDWDYTRCMDLADWHSKDKASGADQRFLIFQALRCAGTRRDWLRRYLRI